MVEQRDVYSGHCRKVSRMIIAYSVEQRFNIILGNQNLLRADPRSSHHADREAVDVKVWDDKKVRVVVGTAHVAVSPALLLNHVGEDVVVCEHSALGHARSA